MASIARNNLVAAAQNIQGAQRYLSNVEFPYCAPAEVTTLNKATAYIFTDMQTAERHQHAMDCYSTTAKRCGALLQWINQVGRGLSSLLLIMSLRLSIILLPKIWLILMQKYRKGQENFELKESD